MEISVLSTATKTGGASSTSATGASGTAGTPIYLDNST
jgi:hypothetical protein